MATTAPNSTSISQFNQSNKTDGKIFPPVLLPTNSASLGFRSTHLHHRRRGFHWHHPLSLASGHRNLSLL